MPIHNSVFLMAAFVGTLGLACAAEVEKDARLRPAVVRDVFDRDLAGVGITLVDWEGYMANPAPRFTVEAPAEAALPARVVLRSSEARLYFDLPSTAGAGGPRKELGFREPGQRGTFRLAIWPDRDGVDEDHELIVELTDAKGRTSEMRLPVHVVDQDCQRGQEYPIAVDYGRDRTGFFADEAKRRTIEQAARDWACFLADPGLEVVPAGAEKTWIWEPDGFRSGAFVTNAAPYSGFLVYAYGIRTPELRSGGEPSREGGFQRAGEADLRLRRSGGLEIEVRGNYNQRGWLVELPDREWFRATNRPEVPNDLYSIAHHELGHALAFNPHQPAFAEFKSRGRMEAEDVRKYLGAAPSIDRADHFRGTVDPASGFGAFGWEYHGVMPRGRWLITKFDLMGLRAVGYRLRETSAFRPLAIAAELPTGSVGQPYTGRLLATGGTPAYCWDIVAGRLPPGLALDSFSGRISGTPREAGEFSFTARVRDSVEPGAAQRRESTIAVR